ncbi:hypothetical protein CDL15_Pgr017232 [Punica granatum]|uniref:Uncharacterized protein n=1 Tax=Punica granatum TaxID=22663 RepID=A0A218WR46_PUNGR|nr:hypothetical protein CDL15_Pgr017232 [Punica granatum]
MVKELSLYMSLSLGKPSYLTEDRGPLLGEGIISSSGQVWVHQRKIISPELYLDKVKLLPRRGDFIEAQATSEGHVQGKHWVPGLRHLPTNHNREIWKLEKEIRSKILGVVKRWAEANLYEDLLQMILEGAKSCSEQEGLPSSIYCDKFIVDNCKNLHETAAVTASWSLILLAAYPDC